MTTLRPSEAVMKSDSMPPKIVSLSSPLVIESAPPIAVSMLFTVSHWPAPSNVTRPLSPSTRFTPLPEFSTSFSEPPRIASRPAPVVIQSNPAAIESVVVNVRIAPNASNVALALSPTSTLFPSEAFRLSLLTPPNTMSLPVPEVTRSFPPMVGAIVCRVLIAPLESKLA